MTRTAWMLLLLSAAAAFGQTIIYSGREYKQVGKSWFQIREINTVTGRRSQLTTSASDHSNPWCAPDGPSVYFTKGYYDPRRQLFGFDRITHAESLRASLASPLVRIVGAIGAHQLVLQEDSVIEIVDFLKPGSSLRFDGSQVAISPDQQFLAWQTRTDILAQPRETSHVILYRIDGGVRGDIGEGGSPVFLPDGRTLLFARLNPVDNDIAIVRFNLADRSTETEVTSGAYFIFGVSLTISPDGRVPILATDSGGYGSAVFWYLGQGLGWGFLDDNLEGWGGWSAEGRLVYATFGRDVAKLDARRSVFVSQIKVLNSHDMKIETLVGGVSANFQPSWCASVANGNALR